MKSKKPKDTEENNVLISFLIMLIISGYFLKKLLYPLQTNSLLEFILNFIMLVAGSVFLASILSFIIFLIHKKK